MTLFVVISEVSEWGGKRPGGVPQCAPEFAGDIREPHEIELAAWTIHCQRLVCSVALQCNQWDAPSTHEAHR